ncbi:MULTISPECIES: tautomerase family protein [Pseudomonas]|uniref:tautomerase family protein n=1 Tax=Pseudomonas TaxID=286 RepID=UPI0007176729|nr:MULTISPECIES: tautomerase family protein [Pseudomonas]KRV32164.1 4-oxalocrotonate tautomerase [Pseudomonas aeruginosa]KSF44342.1 4-oxalocrotonate tautomerase [Pseudomonas aeruginosa]MBL7228321.1 tautomerase family protein [Pseudomonas sp.]MCT5235665.1 tautomerase family protein [Pseudomonas aeruginosa]MCV6434592.1 tautomerase family protein [Pseudomonas aeruginosa]
MPVVNFHLVDGYCSAEQKVRLLKDASQLYSQVLRSPMERVRAFITLHAADEFAVVGEVTGVNGLHAPFFEFIVLEGRPLDERQALMSGFTELLVEILAVERSVVRGRCIRVEPQDWSIGGLGADVLREQEIRDRAAGLGVAG